MQKNWKWQYGRHDSVATFTVIISLPLTPVLYYHLPPWIRSFDLFRHRRIAIVSWGVHGLFFLEVCS